MFTIDNETFENLKKAFDELFKKCEKLDKIDEILETAKSINSSYKELRQDIEAFSEKNNGDHVKRNFESAVKDEDENVERNIESSSGKYEQKMIAQKVTKAINKIRRIKKSRKKSSSSIAALKVSTKFACEALSASLKKDPLRAFRRRKKYKCDDGG
jgi:dGTP triphosphohydrolase